MSAGHTILNLVGISNGNENYFDDGSMSYSNMSMKIAQKLIALNENVVMIVDGLVLKGKYEYYKKDWHH